MMIKAALLLCLVAVSFKSSNAVDNYKFDIPKAMETFDAIDTSDDNAICRTEFVEYFRNKAKEANVGRTIEDAEFHANFNLMDISSDNELNQREFVIGYSLYQEFRDSLDGDKNYLLSKAELLTAFDVGSGLVPGKVTFVEFLARIMTDEKLAKY